MTHSPAHLKEVTVSTSDFVERTDFCPGCAEPMFYRVDDAKRIIAMLCGNLLECPDALKERHIPAKAERRTEGA